MLDATKSNTYPCRSVTPEEVAHYQEYGWVQLKKFVDPEMLRKLLDMARERMGSDGDSNEGLAQPYFNVGYGGGVATPLTRELIDKVGKNARELMGRRGVGIRYFTDFFAPKLPSKKKTRSNAGNGATSFHQDFITFAVDRTGGMTFWIPLEAYGPDAGTMSFVKGSHRHGVMGSYHTYSDVRDSFLELNDMEMSDPINYELGDITVHSHLTIHGAGLNLLDKPRWAYLILTQPADVCWNGAPSEAFDPAGLKPNQRLDDERFPVIG